ncbi:5-formyltetrahydrofolate cyclo-ligase [Aerobium aerolatum]|uniref:5-formyltetrahydrofolate cyclo-ligase n=1 Tax=Aquamicrobium aerolatum DSM 21857 TaxID=1121003 RepID=A0A1I3KJE5_9HYPH|nr:5-formyltetrahydrofolate cyclo-ligase [Aquamicrobium aerolatum]SFI72534.1 5,10-methenyltetrahydrofolate synthetase [Aquamicrobium aerolatum DSM 21857]
MSQIDDPFEGKGALKPWRKVERERLIAARLALPADVRNAHAAIIAEKLDARLGDASGKVIAIYWPFRGEPDLRGWAGKMSDQGATIALPVVVEKAAPLVFRSWKAGEKLEKGVWNIPIPAEGAVVIPDVVISPVVGFDGRNYRLGYGGGFYDRTLAALARRPVVIGVGYELQRIATIHPQPHDIAMDVVLTEAD